MHLGTVATIEELEGSISWDPLQLSANAMR